MTGTATADDRTAGPVVIAIDVGGTKLAGGLVARDGSATNVRTVAAPRGDAGADPAGAATTALVDHLTRTAADAGLTVVGTGIGIPEYVRPDGGVARREVLDWDDGTIERLRRAGAGARFESDVRCAALAERIVGSARAVSSLLYVSIGTGISHAFVVGDTVWAGARGEAIALGELPVDPDDAVLVSAPLTVERQASGRALEDALAAAPGGADEVLARAGRIAGAAISAAVRILDPEVVVLGGGLGSGDRAGNRAFRAALVQRFGELAGSRPHPPPVVPSALGPTGGVIGAGLQAWSHLDPPEC